MAIRYKLDIYIAHLANNLTDEEDMYSPTYSNCETALDGEPKEANKEPEAYIPRVKSEIYLIPLDNKVTSVNGNLKYFQW